MAKADETYHALLEHILQHGKGRGDRTGVGTFGVFGYQNRYDLNEFPLLTTKRIPTKGLVTELTWFLAGRTDNQYLEDRGVTIWREWSTKEQCAKFGRAEGDLGPIYGHTWRNFGATQLPDGTYAKDGKDQIAWVVNEIQRNPNSRRLVVSAWDAKAADAVALPPCHTLFQFYVREEAEIDPDYSGLDHQGGKPSKVRYLDCQLYQRSADVFLGVPWNIGSYALLTHLVACATGLKPGEFVHTFGDVHIYTNHVNQVAEQLSRPTDRPGPRLVLNERLRGGGVGAVLGMTVNDVEFVGYDPMPSIKAPVAV